jgi:reductive dehalogenase
MTFNAIGRGKFNEAVGGDDVVAQWGADQNERRKQYRAAGDPGYTVEDMALAAGRGLWGDFSNPSGWGFLGRRTATTPDGYGLAKWSGTPEENTKLVRAASRFLGAAEISIVELDPSTSRKLIYAYEFGDNKAYEFENVDDGYETDSKRVIPEKARYAITQGVHQGYETTKRGMFSMRYPWGRMTQDATQNFLHGLGYKAFGPYRYTNNMSANVGLTVLGGMGELGRYNQTIYPVHGSMMGVASTIITDLPLTPTEPIEAGMHTFCFTCKRCSDICPGEALSSETDPTWDTLGPWNHTGYKHWWFWGGKCFPFSDIADCNTMGCGKVCVFAKRDKAFIHDAVKSAVATTSLFNGFFLTMDKAFGYARLSVTMPASRTVSGTLTFPSWALTPPLASKATREIEGGNTICG